MTHRPSPTQQALHSLRPHGSVSRATGSGQPVLGTTSCSGPKRQRKPQPQRTPAPATTLNYRRHDDNQPGRTR